MADFIGDFWHWYISIPVVLGLIWCAYLAWSNSKSANSERSDETMGHVWDEDLEEYNNPLPKWWLNMFYITVVFAFGYLLLFPGLGTWKGLLNWSEVGRYEAEVELAQQKYGALFEAHLATPLEQLAGQADAMNSAKRLFANNCALCHGADARGAPGFPNLADRDWLYGGEGETIKTSITQGRNGAMPGWLAVIGEPGVESVTQYVYSLSHPEHNSDDPESLAKGQEIFGIYCMACHGTDAKGNPVMGAPDLTDNIWLYTGDLDGIKTSIADGRSGVMPAQAGLLDESKIHLLTAYIMSLQPK